MNKYTPLALLGLAALPANAFFLMPCWPVSTQRIDPIVDPGKISTHVHQIAGGDSFSPDMSYPDTQSASCTTCFVKGDKSNYWIPALYAQNADGSFEQVEQVGSASMYYFNEASRLGSGEKMEPFPKGLRILAGDPDKRSGGTDAASQAINYKCLDYSGTPTDSKTFPTNNCPNGVRAEVTYPSCWDGKNLDSDDHKSHMAYPTVTFESGACPPSHPHHLVTLKVEFIFNTNKYSNLISGGKQPFVWSSGDTTGYGLHADYVMGWDYDLLSSAVEQCFDEFGVLENCAPFAGQIQSAYVNPGTCKVDSVVDEEVGPSLSKLPGCNPLTSGPNAASKQTCGESVKMLGKWANGQGGGLVDSLGFGNDTGSGSASSSAAAPAYSQGAKHSAPAPEASAAAPSARPHAFYSANAAPVAAAVAQSSAPVAAPQAPAPSAAPAPAPEAPQGNHKVLTVTEIVTETTYVDGKPALPSTEAAAPAPEATGGWAKWRREIGDDVHKHRLQHIQRRRRSGSFRH